jgi:hypothetical protein
LVSQNDRAGQLLRDAEQAFRSQLSPERAWKRFQSRRQRRWVLRFAVLAAATGAALVFIRHQLAARVPTEPAVLVAERVSLPQPSSFAPQRAALLEPPPSPPASAVPRSRPLASLARSGAASTRNAVAPLAAEPLTDTTCRALAKSRPEQAVDCYLTIARESGLGAEVALYEAARLSAEVLDDAPRALTLLEQHATRFPNSVLRVEVKWLEIRSLERAGRLDQALRASEALLDSSVGRVLAPKLHLLRGRIYAGARHECALALPEYVALLGEPGPTGDEAELSRARCLEQLQRTDEARAAYQRYLGRADARSAEAARARLAALSNDTKASEGQP